MGEHCHLSFSTFSSSCQSWDGHLTEGLSTLEGDRGALFDEVWTALLTYHTDPTLACLDWPRVREAFGPKVAGAADDAAAAAALDELLAALGQPLVRVWLPGASEAPTFDAKRSVTIQERNGKKLLVVAFNQWDPKEIETTVQHIENAMGPTSADTAADSAEAPNAVSAIVMDVRGPSSTAPGVLPAVAPLAAAVADAPIELGLLRPRSGDAAVLEAAPTETSTRVPLHIVIDGDTDGGAAIAARAWKESGRATVYGPEKKLPLRPTPTTLLPLSGGGVLRLVVADFHPPAEKTNWSTPKRLAAVEPNVVHTDPLEAALGAAAEGGE